MEEFNTEMRRNTNIDPVPTGNKIKSCKFQACDRQGISRCLTLKVAQKCNEMKAIGIEKELRRVHQRKIRLW